MSRGLIAAVIGVGAAVALGLVYYFDRKEEGLEATAVPAVSAPSQSSSAGSSAAPADAASQTASGSETETSSDAAAAESEEAAPLETAADAVAQQAPLPAGAEGADAAAASGQAAIPPSFDVVRVEQSGEGVIAGRAPPGVLVIVYDGDKEIGRVRADAAGNWVLVLAIALAPGTHELRLVALLDSGERLHAEQAAIIALRGPKSLEAIEQASAHGLASAIEDMKGPPPASATAASVVASAVAPSAETRSDGSGASSPPLVVLVPDAAGKASKLLQSPGSDRKGEGISDKGLELNSIDYNEEGKAVVAGRGEPGSKVVVYLDNEPLAAAQVDEDGNWPAVLDMPIEPGLHKLRIDQVDESGTVIARVETPFSRADLTDDAFAEGAVVVQPGNSLWRISRRVYGEGVRYSLIYEANDGQIRDPDLIYPGQIFTIPKLQ